jgi:cyclopropane fatty-acyl-phospholipid synthase-like methyltransferase
MELIMSAQSHVITFLEKAGVNRSTFRAKSSFYKEFDTLFTLGWGNEYIKGNFEIENEDLIQMLSQIYKAFGSYLQGNDYAGIKSLRFHYVYNLMNATQLINWQFIRSKYFADIHYELPHQLFVHMLGESRVYSSGYWKKGVETLDQAQTAKFDLSLRKQSLKDGDNVLEFGCGSGSWGQYAGKLGVQVVGLNICHEQLAYAQAHNDQEVPAIYLDFNLVKQSVAELQSILEPYGIKSFDAVTFFGSSEHIGFKNYEGVYRKMYELLKPEGQILCHTIGSYHRTPILEPYIAAKIFPDAQFPTVSQMTKATESAGFRLMDYHDLEPGLNSYAKTLRCWLANFIANWDNIKTFLRHDDKEAFYREWVFYLMICIGGYEAGNIVNVSQYVFRKAEDLRPFIPVR